MLNSSGCSNVFTRQCNYSATNEDNNKVFTTNSDSSDTASAYYDMVDSIKNTLGKRVMLIGSGPAHVGNLLNEYGIPMIVWGPKGENAHSYDEYVEIGSIPKTVEIYFKTICNYFGLKEDDLNPKLGAFDYESMT